MLSQEGQIGSFVSVYVDEPEKTAALVSSGDHTGIRSIVAANPHPADKDRTKRSVARLVDGDFAPGEQPDRHEIIDAFRALCEQAAAAKTTVEIYVDEDHFPEIWNFVYDAGDPPVELPISAPGSTA